MKIKTFKTLLSGTLVGFGLLVSSHTNAAFLEYDLTLTNGNPYIPDGTSYARVKIDNDGATGLINFTVTILDSILTVDKTANFGLQSFGFNVLPLPTGNATSLEEADVINLPTGTKNWSAKASSSQDGFGTFDMRDVPFGAPRASLARRC